MGRVHAIVVENFKSYAGRVDIGPFSKFTCIIGPNGAGKSNLMDAISFVLGVQARVLRSERLRDLVYRKEGEDPKKNERTAFVELVFVGDSEGEAEGARLVFRRSISKTGEARFQVNNETMSQAEYHKTLESINILSKVRNFLVFQGDVEATASRQGKELTAFFEQISGSEAFRLEYEQLAVEKSRKEDNARYLFGKKRNAINEKKRMSHQKDEADDYRRLEADRGALQREFYLFRLHGISKHLEDLERTKGKGSVAKEKLEASIARRKEGLQLADQERAQAHLEAQQTEKASAIAKCRMDKVDHERIAAKSRLSFLQQRIGELQQNKDKTDSRKIRLTDQVEELRKEQNKLEAEECELKDRLAQGEAHFTPEQRQEYERVRKETERITAASSDGTRQLEHQIRAMVVERRQVEGDNEEHRARYEFLQKRLAELQEGEKAAQEAVQRDGQTAQQGGAELTRLWQAASTRNEEAEQLKEERRQLADTIQDVTATERQLQREKEMSQICTNLAGAVPGVFGRVLDLCRPVQKRFHVAVNVAIGKFLDAVIVDTSETARICVRYLKERMLPPMTFLPLSDLRVFPADPRLQALVSNERAARLALNCVSFDEQFARAFEFMIGDTVISDTMADGRRLAFGEVRQLGLNCKVVTLAGEAIAKNGNLSVNSDAAREGSTRFDLTELGSTRARVEAIDRRLHELHQQEAAVGADTASLQEQARRSEARANEAAVRLKYCQDQLRAKTQEFAAAEVALQALAPQAASLAKEEARLRADQGELEKRVSKQVAGYYTKLSEAMGVADAQAAVREWRKEEESGQSRMVELRRRLSNVRAELSMVEQTLQEKGARSPADLLPKFQAEVEETAQREAALTKKSVAATGEVEALRRKVKECLESERDKEKSLGRLRLEAKEKKQQLMAVEKRLSDLSSEEQTLCNARADILRQSVLEDIEVPVLNGGLEALQDLAEAPSQHASAPTQDTAAPAEAASMAVDFSGLPKEKQQVSTGPAAKTLEEEYKSEMERLRVEMKRLSPNLKAIEQIQGVAENVQAASRQADVARRDIEDIDTRFEKVRKARKEQFMDCFKKVADEIGNTYKRLTSNTAGLHADGGSAFLDLEDTEDPFNGGIKFTAMPPAKRFRDMHLLSGGEKTLAAMALLFAVHAYQKPPFMVLDEVDAALDANNVKALAGYVEKADCQTIVISLKDSFFVRSETLVGVWKDKPAETSAVLTLDLRRYLPIAGAS